MKKTLKELTLKNNFLFAAVMCERDNCKRLLEMILGFPIEKVDILKEKSILYHPEYKGIRLDIYAKDQNHTCYNVEMQLLFHEALGKRARYYHSQIDMELLSSGSEYSELPPTYVIFICDFDPFGAQKYCYSFKNRCPEVPGLDMQDDSYTIFLSTAGTNDKEVPPEMVKFLKFLNADLTESLDDFNDDYVKSLQESIHEIKSSRRMEERFMSIELALKDERRFGVLTGTLDCVLELLADLGSVPDDLQKRILSERRLDVAKRWHKLAATSDSIEQFMKDM